MKCKFCGCTDRKACAIPMIMAPTPAVEELLALYLGTDYPYPSIALPGQVAEFTTPCHWSAPEICSAPACVEKGYAEAREFVAQMIEELDGIDELMETSEIWTAFMSKTCAGCHGPKRERNAFCIQLLSPAAGRAKEFPLATLRIRFRTSLYGLPVLVSHSSISRRTPRAPERIVR